MLLLLVRVGKSVGVCAREKKRERENERERERARNLLLQLARLGVRKVHRLELHLELLRQLQCLGLRARSAFSILIFFVVTLI